MMRQKIDALDPPLVCPVCHGPFAWQGTSLRCGLGHTFDLARNGALNFLSQKINQKPSSFYPNEQELHDLPPYRELLDYCVSSDRAGTLCLTGSSLGSLLPPGAIGFEASGTSVALQLKQTPGLPLFAAAAQRLPLSDGILDRLLRMDEHPDLTESLRVVRPGGSVIRIIPSRSHLLEVRRQLFSGRRMGLREKPELIRALHEAAGEGHSLTHRVFSRSLTPDPAQWAALLGPWQPIPEDQAPRIMAQVASVTFAWDVYELIREPSDER